MKFIIRKTSDFRSHESPCDGAVLSDIKDTDDEDRKFWQIEINSLEELIALREQVKEPLIVNHPYEECLEGMWELEIYDDYRE